MRNAVQLITYADRLGGGGLRDLFALLQGPLRGLFGGVHILPFFHPIDGADAGFDPIDHTQVDSRLGSWEDLQVMAVDYELMADVIVNHMSADSPQFLEYSSSPDADSLHDGLFLTRDSVFPGGATDEELRAIYRPRPGLPFTELRLANGATLNAWTTFTPKQIDINVQHPQGAAYLQRILETFGSHGIRMIRLDAVGYAIKKRGTSCFMLPETFEFIADFAQRARQRGMECLVEVHSYFRRQIEIARGVDWVYDFALPPLVLHAFSFHTARCLKVWIGIRPTNALTVLDTHDGIGIVDVGADPADRTAHPGLVPPAELDGLVERIHESSRGGSRLATGAAACNLDLYQVNCTFYDALGRNDLQYLLARAVQFFLPGIPQVYYVGLLAGVNDMELLQHTGVGRDINRSYYTLDDVQAALRRPVVQRLCELMRLRNEHPAFQGRFELLDTPPASLQMRWTRGQDVATLSVDFESLQYSIEFTGQNNMQRMDLSTPLAAG